MTKKIALKYIGDGTFLVGVPARDLTPDEIKLFYIYSEQQLLDSGLYTKPKAQAKEKGK